MTPLHNNIISLPRLDLAGQRFGRLIAQSYIGNSQWNCHCDCGRETVVQTNHIRTGHTASCGCLKKEHIGKSPTHGLTSHPIYKRWSTMIQRCYRPTHIDFSDYGGRGITVCERWRISVASFLEDMGEPPEGMTIDRKDNNGPYSPENCRWATPTEQHRNKRNNRLLTFNGKTLPVVVWSEDLAIDVGVLRARLWRGWSTERTLTTPVASRKLQKNAC